MPRTFPHGLDCEAFTFDALSQATRRAEDAFAREHVTPWIRNAPHLTRANVCSTDSNLAQHRWTLDYPEDMAFFRAVFEVLEDKVGSSMEDVLAVLQEYPELSEINRSRRQN